TQAQSNSGGISLVSLNKLRKTIKCDINFRYLFVPSTKCLTVLKIHVISSPINCAKLVKLFLSGPTPAVIYMDYVHSCSSYDYLGRRLLLLVLLHSFMRTTYCFIKRNQHV